MKVPSTKQKQDEPGTSWNTKNYAHGEKKPDGIGKKRLKGQFKRDPNSQSYNLGNKIKVALDYKINYKININESMLA